MFGGVSNVFMGSAAANDRSPSTPRGWIVIWAGGGGEDAYQICGACAPADPARETG